MEPLHRRILRHVLDPFVLALTERETSRLLAWSHELRRVHSTLREALDVTRTALKRNEPVPEHARNLTLLCHGFCLALEGHHRGEDRWLFPAIQAAHPELAPVLRALEQDHSMIAHLLNGLRSAVDGAAGADDVDRHLEGIEAVMENHFRYEERQLITVLEGLTLEVEVSQVLGPL